MLNISCKALVFVVLVSKGPWGKWSRVQNNFECFSCNYIDHWSHCFSRGDCLSIDFECWYFSCDTIVDGFSSSSVPLVEKEVFEQIVQTCATQMEGIDTLENAIVKVAGLEQVSMFLTNIWQRYESLVTIACQMSWEMLVSLRLKTVCRIKHVFLNVLAHIEDLDIGKLWHILA